MLMCIVCAAGELHMIWALQESRMTSIKFMAKLDSGDHLSMPVVHLDRLCAFALQPECTGRRLQLSCQVAAHLAWHDLVDILLYFRTYSALLASALAVIITAQVCAEMLSI